MVREERQTKRAEADNLYGQRGRQEERLLLRGRNFYFHETSALTNYHSFSAVYCCWGSTPIRGHTG